MSNKSFILCWPHVEFNDSYSFKDPGEIPRAFHELGYDSYIIVGKNLSNNSIPGVEVIETGHPGRGVSKKLLTLLTSLKLILKESPDVVMSYYIRPIAILLPLIYKILGILIPSTRKRQAKWVLKMDSDGRILDKGLMKGRLILSQFFSSLFYNVIVIETEEGYNRLIERPINSKKLMVIPDSYSETLYPSLFPPDSKREKNILTVARMVREKGIEVLLKSFKILVDSFPEWSVKIIGEIFDRSYYEELLGLSHELKLDEKVKFLGKLSNDELRDIYESSAIFCLPSNNESFGIARTEAIVNGLPVVTTYAGGGDNLTGAIAVPPADERKMAEALRELMESREMRIKLASEGQKKLRTWKLLMSALVNELYRTQK